VARGRFETGFGTLHLVGRDEEALRAARELAVGAAREAGPVGGFVPFLGARAYFKGGPLTGGARLRHALRAHVLRRALPRLNEYRNLRWLERRLFQVPAPLAAGALWRRGAARYQLLLTAEVRETRTLREFLASGDSGRGAVLSELARELARMHALGFVHRDPYPRNLLVGASGPGRRVFFLDAWHGGPAFQLRGPAYDLACFLLHAPELLAGGEARAFLARYLDERAVQGRPAGDAGRFTRAVERRRRALVRRLRRDPARLRGGELPPLDWTV